MICAVLFGHAYAADNRDYVFPIVFQKPVAFNCGKTMQWDDLQSWQGTWDTSICANEANYIVSGKVSDTNAYRVSAEIYVPEAEKSWPASGGKFKTINPSDGGFVARFCIPRKGPNREFRFQVYAKDRSLIGKACIITVEEEW